MRRAWLVLGVALALAATASVAACGDKVQPTGSKLVTDVPPLPPPSTEDDASAPVFEAGASDGALDAYLRVDANLGACSGCVCSPDTSYCFAGATPRAPTDGGPTACTVSTSATPEVGCNTLPSACTQKPTCACIIDTLQPLYRCYLNCQTSGDGFLVYCPNP